MPYLPNVMSVSKNRRVTFDEYRNKYGSFLSFGDLKIDQLEPTVPLKGEFTYMLNDETI
jgi:hypothetical protein